MHTTLRFLRRHWIFFALLLFVVGWSVLLLLVSPRELVDAIGVTNTYIVVFLLALLGGMSSVTGVSFYAATATLAVGGANPWLLGLVGGTGIFLSDSIFYYLARRGVRVVSERWQERVQWVRGKIDTLPRWAILGGTYLYTGFSPLPTDVLMVALAISRYRFIQIAPFVAAGGITFVTLVSLLAQVGISPW